MTSVSKGGWLTGGCSFSFQAELQCRLPTALLWVRAALQAACRQSRLQAVGIAVQLCSLARSASYGQLFPHGGRKVS